MRTIRRAGVFLALTVASAAACTDNLLPPVVRFADAIAMPGCGPADGGAVYIFLTSQPIVSDAPSAPYLRVDIWRPLSELNNQTFSLNSGSQSATAFYFPDGSLENVVQVAGGSVTIGAASEQAGVNGEVNAVIPEQGVMRGTFTARWIPTRTTLDLCG